MGERKEDMTLTLKKLEELTDPLLVCEECGKKVTVIVNGRCDKCAEKRRKVITKACKRAFKAYKNTLIELGKK
jgi:transcription elongation factor Elf1